MVLSNTVIQRLLPFSNMIEISGTPSLKLNRNLHHLHAVTMMSYNESMGHFSEVSTNNTTFVCGAFRGTLVKQALKWLRKSLTYNCLSMA